MDRGDTWVGFVGLRMSAAARAKPKADEDQAGGFRLLGAGAHSFAGSFGCRALLSRFYQVNAVLLVPAGRLNDDFGKRPLARQHRGQKYAVVARVRLAADHGNVEAVGSPRNELLDRSHSRHCRRPPTAVV